MSFPQGFYRCQSNSLNVLFLGRQSIQCN
uniref:Uncharacterized protein n=1 Tax=Anguilla anguilla TaxID=7936 RepID=A0A0E9S076_ANGAN